jgi:hypothetical protein
MGMRHSFLELPPRTGVCPPLLKFARGFFSFWTAFWSKCQQSYSAAKGIAGTAGNITHTQNDFEVTIDEGAGAHNQTFDQMFWSST